MHSLGGVERTAQEADGSAESYSGQAFETGAIFDGSEDVEENYDEKGEGGLAGEEDPDASEVGCDEGRRGKGDPVDDVVRADEEDENGGEGKAGEGSDLFLKERMGERCIGVGGAKDGEDTEDKPEAMFEVKEASDEEGDGHCDGCSGRTR